MALPKRSPYRPIFDGLIRSDYELLITESIFQEYKEIIGQRTTEEIANNISDLFSQLENVKLVKVYFRWQLIKNDPDDNKFVDCAIQGNALFIVSNDAHFKELKNIDFPKMAVLSADDFLAKLSV